MPAIRNIKKTLVKHLSLKQESVKNKLLLERIGIDPTSSTKLYNKLVKADPCWHKIDNFYFSFCSPELHFCKNKKLLCIKEYKELLEPTLDCVRATGHKTPGESLDILQSMVMIQLISRRILRD